MADSPTTNVAPGPPPELPRPEVEALIAAIGHPENLDDRDPAKGQFVVLDLLVARDLYDLIEDLCTEAGDHKRCEACGEAVACEPCGLGAPIGWCDHVAVGLCPECRLGACPACRKEAA